MNLKSFKTKLFAYFTIKGQHILIVHCKHIHLIYFLFYHRPFLGPRSLPLQRGRKEKKRPSLTSFDNIAYPSPLQFRTSMHPSPPQTILLITLAAPFDYYYTVFILLALPCISFFLLVIFHLLRFFL